MNLSWIENIETEKTKAKDKEKFLPAGDYIIVPILTDICCSNKNCKASWKHIRLKSSQGNVIKGFFIDGKKYKKKCPSCKKGTIKINYKMLIENPFYNR